MQHPFDIWSHLKRAEELGFDFKKGHFTVPEDAVPKASTPEDGPSPFWQLAKGAASNLYGKISQVASPAGAIVSANAETPEAAGIGGILAGMSGGPLGMLMGGVGGLTDFFQKKSARESYMEAYNKNMLDSRTVAPFAGSFEKGGFPELEELPFMGIQTKEGEQLFTVGGEIVDTMSDDLHKDMKKGEVTDVVPRGTFVFSDSSSLDTSNMSDKKDVMYRFPGRYSETDGNVKGEEVRFTDFVGKGKMTYAEAAMNLKKKIPLLTEKHGDILTEMTNAKNLQTRMPFVMRLIEMQETSKKTVSKRSSKKNNYKEGEEYDLSEEEIEELRSKGYEIEIET